MILVRGMEPDHIMPMQCVCLTESAEYAIVLTGWWYTLFDLEHGQFIIACPDLPC